MVSKAMHSEMMKKIFFFLLPFILTAIIVLSIVAVVRAAETGVVPAKEGMKTEEMIASPAPGSAGQAQEEAVPGDGSQTQTGGEPSVPAASPESPKESPKSDAGGGTQQ